MFKFGNLHIDKQVILAPMAGITSFGYRKFMSQFGLGYAVTEMVSDMGLIYGNKETKSYITFDKLDCPIGVQLFGFEPKNIAKAVQICEKMNQNIAFYDVNMGCPVNKVFKTGAGSALLKDPKRCGDIIRAIKEVTNKPVSAKIRLGVDSIIITYKEVIKELENAGVDLIAIHPRTTKEMYGGKPHYDLIKNLKSEMKVPLVVSGNIFSYKDALEAMEITGADAVMVARGAIGNPTLITNINNALSNKDTISSSLDEQIKYCLSLTEEMIQEKGELVAMRVMRGISVKFFDGFPKSKTLKSRLSTELNTFADLKRVLSEYKDSICE